jgi:hypothetical protein
MAGRKNMMKDKTLDALYEVYGGKAGWLSHLTEMLLLAPHEMEYLEWRDELNEAVDKKLAEWDKEIEREGGLDIYQEEDLAKKLVLVNNKIKAIETEADRWEGDNRFVFLGLSELDKLAGLRWRLRNRLLDQELPERKVKITDAEIDLARSVPLWKLFQNLPKSRKVLCPYHKEKTPSFHVYDRGYCFGCGISVDAIKWEIDQLGLSFIDAVKGLVVIS